MLIAKEYRHEVGGAKPLPMQNKKLILFVESLVLLPIITTSTSFTALPQTGLGVMGVASQSVWSQKENIEASLEIVFKGDKEDGSEDKILKIKGEKIDAYFEAKGMPMVGLGEKLAEEAEEQGLDWRLLAAIAVRESTGGKFECKRVLHNPFGWGSCKVGFASKEHAIETIAMNLGGKNPNTERYYANKDTLGILRAYNPPSIVPRYAEQVIKIMNTIGPEEVDLEVAMK